MGTIPTNPPIIPVPFATNGQKNAIPQNAGTVGSANASWDQGFPGITMIAKQAGGKPPLGKDFNGVLNQLSSNAFFAQSGCVYAWSDTLNYLAGCHAQGTDGHEYIALQPSGPDVPASGGGYVGAQNPTSSTGYWLDFTSALSHSGDTGYELCEFYYFRHPSLRPGFVQAAGGLISNAATLYPDAWAYLQTADGQLLCKTEVEWQAMSNATYYTDASGNTEGWNGVGGVPWFVIDTNAGTLRVPDVRGMYAEAAGLDSLSVGGVHEDRIRNITGSTTRTLWTVNNPTPAGAFYKIDRKTSGLAADDQGGDGYLDLGLDASRIIPTGSHAAPRAWGSLACVYLGA